MCFDGPGGALGADTADGFLATQPIRATKPFLDPACISFVSLDAEPTDSSVSCGWSDGFPAVSRDGSLVVTKVYPDDGRRGYPGLTVRFIDVKTSKTVRDVVVLDPDEIDPTYSGSSDDAAYAPLLAKHRTKLASKIHRRVQVAQTLIDAKGYRSMSNLRSSNDGDFADEKPTSTYAQIDMHGNNTASVRAIDPSTNTSLWRHTFGDPQNASRPIEDPDQECGGNSLADITFAWDPETRIVLASSTWHSGGCQCGSGSDFEVVTI